MCILMLSCSSSQAIAAVRHHLVVLDVNTAAAPAATDLMELDRNWVHPGLE